MTGGPSKGGAGGGAGGKNRSEPADPAEAAEPAADEEAEPGEREGPPVAEAAEALLLLDDLGVLAAGEAGGVLGLGARADLMGFGSRSWRSDGGVEVEVLKRKGGQESEQPSLRRPKPNGQRAASLFLSLSLFLYIHNKRTILPDAKISAVVFGSRMRMMTAAKRCFEWKEEEEKTR